MSVVLNKNTTSSTAIVTYKPREYTSDSLDERVIRSYRNILESQYLNTYKALHLGGKDTTESRMIRFAATICPTHSDSEMSQRIDKYDMVTEHLTHLSDEQFSAFVKAANPVGSGIGGEVLLAEVAGIPVFIKKISLTTIEQQNPKSTANLFKLPVNYQYGVGSMGFGAWRELSAHEMTTKWVLNGECQNFPLMYHSRVLERTISPPLPTTEELENRRDHVEYWNGSSAIGMRAESIATASADVVVVMERLPQALHEWLRASDGKKNLTEQKITRLEREMNLVVAFMRSRGFLHFDAHPGNILSSDSHIYFADFGLATSREFDLSPQEETFFQKHSHYDRYCAVWGLVLSTITATLGDEAGEAAWNTYLETGEIAAAVPTSVASIAERYRPVVVIINRFIRDLRKVSKSTPYPATELALEWAKLQKN